MTKRKRNKFNATEKYNLPYIYWLLNEIELCIQGTYNQGKMNSFELSKLVPKLESLLADICDESGRY
jgi:hypothetical protein